MTWVNIDFPRDLDSALKADDISEVRRRLEAGIDPNSVDSSTQRSLLATAAEAGSSRIVEELLSRGAVAEVGEKGALVAAIETDQSAVVQRLLEAGASIGAGVTYHDEVFLPVVAAPYYAGLDVMRQVYAAKGVEQVEMVWWEDALKAALNRRGIDHLRIVAETVAPRLEIEGATDLEATTLKAAANKLYAAAKRRKDESERAALSDLADTLRGAIDREKLEWEETYELTRSESWDALRERIKLSPAERRAAVAGLQLVTAIGGEKTDYATEILEQKPNPNIRDGVGISALMYAARRGDLHTVHRLLELGADPRAVRTEEPFDSVIDWARYGWNSEVIDLLSTVLGLDEAADSELEKLEGEKRHAMACDLAAAAASEGRWERVEAMLDHGADIDARDASGRTLLMLAIFRGEQDRVRWLVNRGAVLTAKCAIGRSIDSYARESDSNRRHRESVFGMREPETLMIELIEELRSKP